MQAAKNKEIGVLIMTLGVMAFAYLFWYFELDGSVIDYNDTSLVLKMVLTSSSLPLGLYFGLYFYGGKRLAAQIGEGLALLMFLGYVIGFFLHS